MTDNPIKRIGNFRFKLMRKLSYTDKMARQYQKRYVVTGKQTDRHSAMKYQERADTISDIHRLLMECL